MYNFVGITQGLAPVRSFAMSDTDKRRMGFEINIRRADNKQPKPGTTADTPFCMAVLGDFNGRFNQAQTDDKPLAKSKLIAIDRDNFDDVLAGYKLSFSNSATNQVRYVLSN
jgi:predicted component of type VI protein secretion system